MTHIIDSNRKKIHVMIETFNRVVLRIVHNYGARHSSPLTRTGTLRARRVPIFLSVEDADWSVGVVVEAIRSVRRSRRCRDDDTERRR